MEGANASDKSLRSAGRPRDNAAGPALLEAARRLVVRHGYRAVSIGDIAAEAGVGRQTLYRRWPSKAELVLEAFAQSAGLGPASGDAGLEQTLEAFLLTLFANLERDGPAIRSLIASAQDDPAFLHSFRSRFVQPRAQLVRSMLEQARARGELAADADLELALDAFHGSFWYRLLQGQPLDAALAQRLAAFISGALRQPS